MIPESNRLQEVEFRAQLKSCLYFFLYISVRSWLFSWPEQKKTKNAHTEAKATIKGILNTVNCISDSVTGKKMCELWEKGFFFFFKQICRLQHARRML